MNMNTNSYKILILGDTHIPDRATRIPNKVIEWIENNKPYDMVIHTGDLTEEEVLEYLRNLTCSVIVVQGNMDYINLPEYEIIEIAQIKIGIIHGDQVYPRGNVRKLSRIARKLRVNVLISGHTHAPFIVVDSGILHLNPGSLTGVPSGSGGSLIPSFIIFRLKADGTAEVSLFELLRDRIVLSRHEFFKLTPITA